MNRKTTSIYLILLGLILTLLISSCTWVYRQPIHEISLPETNSKLNIPIHLIITEELKDIKWKGKYGLDTHVRPLGEHFQYHTEKMAKNVFMEVTVTDNTEVDLTRNEKGYLLIPKVISIEHITGPLIISKTKTSITMEWKIIKGPDGLIWLETVTGSSGDHLRGYIADEPIKQALNDLFIKSQEEFLSSKLIKKLQPKEMVAVENQRVKPPPVLRPSPEQIKLAIFPFHINKGGVKYGGPIKEPTLLAICQALKANNNFFPIYSYYDIRDEFETDLIDQNLISVDDSEKLWVAKPFSRKIPNIDLSCEIGKKMGVDLTLLVSIVSASQYTYDVVYYLINTKDHSVFKRSDQIAATRFNSQILTYLVKLERKWE